jgi:hypothetical protein
MTGVAGVLIGAAGVRASAATARERRQPIVVAHEDKSRTFSKDPGSWYVLAHVVNESGPAAFNLRFGVEYGGVRFPYLERGPGTVPGRPRLLLMLQALRGVVLQGPAQPPRRRDRSAGGLVRKGRHRDGGHLRARRGRAQACGAGCGVPDATSDASGRDSARRAELNQYGPYSASRQHFCWPGGFLRPPFPSRVPAPRIWSRSPCARAVLAPSDLSPPAFGVRPGLHAYGRAAR